MKREEFLGKLERLLSDIPEDDRKDALDYYTGYLDEAGPEREGEILSELGAPEELAGLIRSGLREGPAEGGEFTDSGYLEHGLPKKRYELTAETVLEKEKERPGGDGKEDRTAPEKAEEKTGRTAGEKEERPEKSEGAGEGGKGGYVKGSYARERKKERRKMTGGRLILAGIGLMLLSPFILSLFGLGIAGAGALAAGVISAAVTFGGLLLAVGILAAALLIAGAAVIGMALICMAVHPTAGLLLLGIGLFLLGSGVVTLVLAILFYGTFLPWVFKTLGACLRGRGSRRRARDGAGQER